MDLKTMTAQTPAALKKALGEAENRLRELRFKVSANQLKDVRELREVRTEIARLRTALHAKARSA